jgi:hypothetical protein
VVPWRRWAAALFGKLAAPRWNLLPHNEHFFDRALMDAAGRYASCGHQRL